MATDKLEMYRGDKYPFTVQLYEDDGVTVLDLTTATGILFSAKQAAADVDEVLDDCEAAWAAGANVTATADTTDVKLGLKACKLVVAAGASAGTILATRAVTSTDLEGLYTSLHIWIKSDVSLDAGDLQFILDNAAACANPDILIDIPAITAATWTRVSLTIPYALRSMAAVICIGVKMVVDKTFTLLMDDIKLAQYVIERLAGAGEGAPTLGVAGFTVLPDLTQYLITCGRFPCDVEVTYASGRVVTGYYDWIDIKADITRPVEI